MIKTMEKPWEFMSSNLHKVCQYHVNERVARGPMIKTLENHDFVVCINGLAFWHSS
jgi:hypothetical protein